MYDSIDFDNRFFSCLYFWQDYKEKPDYGRCVAIVASASLREMIKPGALAIISPILVGGLTFNYMFAHILSLMKPGENGNS